MYFRDQKVILIHVPKTGGNALQAELIEYSLDRKVVDGHRDGYDRFEVQGEVTPSKHATLSDYYRELGEELFDHRIAITARNPLHRAVSMYFSPHRHRRLNLRTRVLRTLASWIGLDVRTGPGAYEQLEVQYDFDSFKQVVSEMNSICDYLRVNGKRIEPDLVIRQENLQSGLTSLTKMLHIDEELTLVRRNASDASDKKLEHVRSDERVVKLCKEKFAEDYEFLGDDRSDP
jgi:hypothetical protein